MVSYFTYCRPPDIPAVLLAFFSFTDLLLTHHSALSYHYDIGDYAVGCPEDWFNVGDRCFHLVDDNVYRWVEGGTKCSQVKGLNSRALHNDNWFLIRDLSAAIRGLSSSNEQFWTGFFVESDQSGALPATIQQADSANEISMYSPIWNEIQPQLAMLVNSSRLCIMLDVAIDEPERYGWTLKNCEEDFPIICETFGCPQEQYRCTDNSACIPQKAVCDGIIDCEDKDDEQNCNCKCDERQTTYNETYGSIRKRGDDQDSCAPTQCSWEIKQTPGTRIRLNLMSMKSSDSGHVRVEGLDSGEVFALQPNGPATIQTSGSHLRVRYVNNSTKPAIGDSTSCVRRFESWNGTFSPPMHVYRKDRYRSSTNCMWVIDNQDGQPLSIQIPLFKLATGDYFLIYDGKIASGNLMGNYSASNEPPSLFVSMQKEVTFRFWAAPTTPGDLGFLVAFERTCIDQHVKQGHGQIQSPAFHQPNARVPFECSWIVDVPCTADTCGLTVYFDALNLTNMDQITLRSANDMLTLDGSTLPMSFRATSPQLRISMRGLTQQFAAKLTFSGDCPTEQVPNAAPQDTTKAMAMFRDQTEFQCDNPTKGSQFLSTCMLGGQWQTSGFSACQNADGNQ
ncbi:hypothetical protein M3Y99_00885700 [Aphelenchoides fujianensis]|nr:hypothetical protein M3Y99_00885700 [Aphelenchoides fujianensis]